jgi:hypothetical protein
MKPGISAFLFLQGPPARLIARLDGGEAIVLAARRPPYELLKAAMEIAIHLAASGKSIPIVPHFRASDPGPPPGKAISVGEKGIYRTYTFHPLYGFGPEGWIHLILAAVLALGTVWSLYIGFADFRSIFFLPLTLGIPAIFAAFLAVGAFRPSMAEESDDDLLGDIGPTAVLPHRDPDEAVWTAAAIRHWVVTVPPARTSENP